MQMSDIAQNIAAIKKRVADACARAGRSPHEITVIAVTKTQTSPLVEAAYRAGMRHFGENRVQEAQGKLPGLSGMDATWHLIGHLQTNKAKSALALFDIIHSVDSIRLAQAISKQADKVTSVLLQVNVAREETKGGFSPEELPQALRTVTELPNIEVEGLMTIAPWLSDAQQVRPFFKRLKQLRDELGLNHLSMGMTDDFEVAIEEGATMVRIGRAIFGERR